MNESVDRWLLKNFIEPAKVIAEYRAYLRAKDEPDVIVRILEYLPDALQGADPAARPRLRYFAEVRTLDGELVATGNPDMSPEMAVDNVHLPKK